MWRPTRQSLFRGFRPHVITLDDGAKTMGGGNGFETRDAEAHDENLAGPIAPAAVVIFGRMRARWVAPSCTA
jgi:hypothetical protein